MANHAGHKAAARQQQQPPKQTAGERGPHEHQVARCKMRSRIDDSGSGPPCNRAEAPHGPALDTAAPENLLRRADEQKTQQKQGRHIPHGVHGFNGFGPEKRQPRGNHVAEGEQAVQGDGPGSADERMARRLF